MNSFALRGFHHSRRGKNPAHRGRTAAPPRRSDLVRALKHDLALRDVALTTNGWLLEKLAPELRAAGLDRINVSVDSLDDTTAGR